MSFNVATPADLQKVGTGVDGWNLDSNYIQTADIDMNGVAFTPIGSFYHPEDPMNPTHNYFTGTYNGDYHRIENLSITSSDPWCGMFAVIAYDARVENLKVSNISVSADYNCGGIAGGYLCGNVGSGIYNVSVEGAVTGGIDVGGLVARVGNYAPAQDHTVSDLVFNIEECAVKMTVNITNGSGGGGLFSFFLGHIDASILNCYVRPTMNISSFPYSGTPDPVGGFGGYYSFSSGINIENCYSAGTITSSSTAELGGFMGDVGTAIVVTNCYYDSITSGLSDDDGRGEPRSTSDMTIPTYGAGTYTGWDFDDVWLNDALGANDYYPVLNWQYPKMAVTTVVGDTIRSTFPFVKIIVVFLLRVTGADHLHFRLKSSKEDINTQDDRERFGYSMDGGSTYIQFPEDGIPAVNPYGLIVAANIEVPPAEVAGLTPYCKIMEGSGAGQWWDLDFAARDDWWSLGLGEGVTASAWEPIFEHEVEGV